MSAELKGSYGTIKLELPTSGVGRDPANRLVINDGETSWHHAQIVQQGQGHNIIDLSSRNGTFVNGQRLLANTPRPLRDGDTIRFGNTTFTYINESLRYTPTKGASPSYTPPPPPSTPGPATSSPSYGSTPASFQQQSPPATPPIAPEKKEKSDGGTPRWVTIAGGLASLATIFGLIFTIYTATHPSPPSPTPGPSTPATSSIPRLHESYTGTLEAINNGVVVGEAPFTMSSLVENNNTGEFSATGTAGTCTDTTYSGVVHSDNSITFTLSIAASSANCGAVVKCDGTLAPDGSFSGRWSGQGAFSQISGSGTWTMH